MRSNKSGNVIDDVVAPAKFVLPHPCVRNSPILVPKTPVVNAFAVTIPKAVLLRDSFGFVLRRRVDFVNRPFALLRL